MSLLLMSRAPNQFRRLPPNATHVTDLHPSLLIQLGELILQIPFVLIQPKALSKLPPLQPSSPLWSHETRSCSESEVSVPDAIAYAPSTEPVVEKAQHEPQRPWFFTGVTAPAVTQSTASGSAAFEVTWSDVAAGFAFFALPKLGLTYTPIALGAINYVVASALYWRYRDLAAYKTRLHIAFWSAGAGILALSIFAKPILLFGEQSQYKDRIVFTAQTPYQKLVITEWQDDHWLFINGSIQFSTYDEERYHEPLVHPAMGVAGDISRILILGGGDGLALREVLKYGSVSNVTLVDLDPKMTRLGSENPILVAANDEAFLDERVSVIHQDAGTYVREAGQIFNVIIIDLPDPKGPDLARLYARDFYRDCKRALAREGVLVTQASSPLHAPKAFQCILKTVASAGLSAVPYHTTIPTMGTWGWVIAQKADLVGSTELKGRLSRLQFEIVETDFINNEAIVGMLQFWKGAFDGMGTLAINTMMDPVVDKYYRESEWGF